MITLSKHLEIFTRNLQMNIFNMIPEIKAGPENKMCLCHTKYNTFSLYVESFTVNM